MSERIRIKQIDPRIYLLDDAGEATGYLVVGTQRAAVIDTMNGIADVCAAVRTLTDLPTVVINTHGHCDHIHGNIYFNEAYLHPDDLPLALEHAQMPDFVQLCAEKSLHMPPFRPIREGDVIDLGGVTLEIFDLPGHTPGGILVLDREDRILFTGDAINRHLWMQLEESLPIGQALAGLEHVMFLRERADHILHGHAQGPEPISLMDELRRGLQELADGHVADDRPYDWFAGTDRQHEFAPGSVICYRAASVMDYLPGDHCVTFGTKDAALARITFPETAPGVYCIDHTVVDPSLKGKGVGGRLVAEAVKAIRAAGGTVTATCSFAKSWLEKHPEA